MKYVLRIDYLRNILIVSIIIAATLPICTFRFIFPLFTEMLVNNAEDDSVRLADHFSIMLLMNMAELSPNSISVEIMEEANLIKKQFGLMKLKIFSKSGEVIFSTDPKDIGRFNETRAFHHVIATREAYKKMVKPGASFLDEQTVNVDVVETYVPIVKKDKVVGVFEIYYDITDKVVRLNKLVFISQIVISILAVSLLCTTIIVLIKAGNNISQRERIEEALRESEKRYRILFENAGDAIFLLETDGEKIGDIIDANKAAAEMYGYSVDELLDLNLIKDLNTPDTAKDWPGFAKRIIMGEWIKAEITRSKKDGTVIPIEICFGLLEYEHHKHLLTIDRDISERKRIEEYLLRVEQMKLVGEWAVGLSYEIRNSIAGIKVSIEVLLEELDISEEDRAIVLKAAEEIERIKLLLKRLLDFANPPKLQNIIVNINDILDKAITFSLKHPFLSSNSLSKIKVSKDFDKNIPEMMADPIQLRQIFINLVFNAIEAMPDGGILGCKSIYDKNANAITIEISDTGKGIDKGIMDDVFKPFFTTKSKGSGLGLAITRRVVEQHGGDISVKIDPDKWTTFNVYLPLIISSDEETDVISIK
jgi:PAS domain S-box-containing protein